MKIAKKEGLHGKFLNVNHDLGRSYLQDMNFFLDWSLQNRLEMIKVILSALGLNFKQINDIIKKSLINETHNHAMVWDAKHVVHRKGATPAEEGQYGIIPGNMRDGTYITLGLGNREYLSSASHGAGRLLGRKEAKRKFSKKQVEDMFKGYDVYTEITDDVIDECPEAYKSLERVINYQRGIVVDVIDHIIPLVVVKGTGA